MFPGKFVFLVWKSPNNRRHQLMNIKSGAFGLLGFFVMSLPTASLGAGRSLSEGDRIDDEAKR